MSDPLPRERMEPEAGKLYKADGTVFDLTALLAQVKAAIDGAGVPVTGTIAIESVKVGSPDAGVTKVYIKTDADGKIAVQLPTGAATEATLAALQSAVDGVIADGKVQALEANSAAIKTAVETVATEEQAQTPDIDAINTNIGAKADASATSDTGTFSLISLIKRVLEKLTAIYTTLGDLYADLTGGWSYAYSDESSAQTDKQLVAAPSAGNAIRVGGLILSNGATAGTVKLEEDTTSAKTQKSQTFYFAINGGAVIEHIRFNCTAAKNLGFTSATVTTHSVGVKYRIIAV